MFTNEDLGKLMDRKGVWFKSIKYFIADSRLTNPFSILSSHEAGERFGEYEEYPTPLAEVFLYNGF